MRHLNLLASALLLAAATAAAPLYAQISISSKTLDKTPAIVTSAHAEAQPAGSYAYAAHTGRIACDSNVFVVVSEDKKHPNHYDLAFGKAHYKTVRVATDSGAIRLEDKAHSIVWLQMSNKSMLFNEKEGKRLANNCRNDAQIAAEKALATSTAPTVLETPAPKSP